MLPSTRKISIVAALIALPLCTFAISKKEVTKLTAISKEMYEQGNEKYVYVDAYKDGLLKDGEDFILDFDDNNMVLNGKEMPEAYKEKHKQFLSEKLNGANVTGKGKGTLHIKDIYDNGSCFRRNTNKMKLPSSFAKQ